jgi:hypothetical protein
MGDALMRLAAALALCLLAVPAQAQNFGNIKPMTVLGNSDDSASKPAAPMPLNAMPSIGIRPTVNSMETGVNIESTAKGATTSTGFEANHIGLVDSGVAPLHGYNFVSALSIWHAIAGGTLSKANATTLDLHMAVTSKTGCDWNAGAEGCGAYQSILGQAEMQVSQGGTNLTTNAQGALYGAGFSAVAFSGAINLVDVKALELNWACRTGSSSRMCGGLALVPFGGGASQHAVSGSVVDAFLDIGNNSTHGIKNLIYLNTAHGTWPMIEDGSGCLICNDGLAGGVALRMGFDFGNLAVTDSYLRGINARIAGNGAYYGGGNGSSGITPAATSWAIFDNLSGAQGEMVLMNRQGSAAGGFAFVQLETGGSANAIFNLDRNGMSLPEAGPLAANAIKPYVYVGTTSGLPTGVPSAASSGKGGVTIDSVNNKLCYYNPGTAAWRCV